MKSPESFHDAKERGETMTYRVKEISPLGFGNANSEISHTKQRESGELSEEVDQAAVEIIVTGSSIRDVTELDDGCIDGRPAVEILYVDVDGEHKTGFVTKDDIHERYKVAGGGYVTGLAMYRGVYPSRGSVEDDLFETAHLYSDANIVCGSHAANAKDPSRETGCGANDKFDLILHNGSVFKKEIAETLVGLLDLAGLAFDQDVYDEVIAKWENVTTSYFKASSGVSRLQIIADAQAAFTQRKRMRKPAGVTKFLAHGHKEDYLVINYLEGKTFSQAAFRKELSEKFPNVPAENLAQAFVVDVQRIVQLAEAIGAKHEAATKSALYAGLAYQLATAATLTDGTLRTFIVT